MIVPLVMIVIPRHCAEIHWALITGIAVLLVPQTKGSPNNDESSTTDETAYEEDGASSFGHARIVVVCF